MVDRVLATGHTVVGFDNMSTGQLRFLEAALAHPKFTLHEGDLLDRESLSKAMKGGELVIHLAANADPRFGIDHPRKDLEHSTTATWNEPHSLRQQGCQRLSFASTGSFHGEPDIFPTPETCPFPVQTSFYAASK